MNLDNIIDILLFLLFSHLFSKCENIADRIAKNNVINGVSNVELIYKKNRKEANSSINKCISILKRQFDLIVHKMKGEVELNSFTAKLNNFEQSQPQRGTIYTNKVQSNLC